MSSDFLVRRMRPGDLGRILEIERACFRRDAYDRKLFAEYARKCGAYFLVARRRGTADLRDQDLGSGGRQRQTIESSWDGGARRTDGGICGYIVTCPFRGGAELVSIAVDPVDRREGAASALLESTLRRLRANDIHRLKLTVRVGNWKAIRFYEKYGFEKGGIVPGYYEDGADGRAMVKLLGRDAINASSNRSRS